MSNLGQLLKNKLNSKNTLGTFLDDDCENNSKKHEDLYHQKKQKELQEKITIHYSNNLFLVDFIKDMSTFVSENKINFTIYKKKHLTNTNGDYLLFVGFPNQAQEINKIKKDLKSSLTPLYIGLTEINNLEDIIKKFPLFASNVNIFPSTLEKLHQFYFKKVTKAKLLENFPNFFEFEKPIIYSFIEQFKKNGLTNPIIEKYFYNMELESLPFNTKFRDTPFHGSKFINLIEAYEFRENLDVEKFVRFLSFFNQTFSSNTIKTKLFFALDKIKEKDLLMNSKHEIIQGYKKRELSFFSEDKIICYELNSESFLGFLMKENPWLIDKNSNNFINYPLLEINKSSSIKKMLQLNKILFHNNSLYLHTISQDNDIDYRFIISEILKSSAQLTFKNVKVYNDREHVTQIQSHIEKVSMDLFLQMKTKDNIKQEPKKSFKI